MENLHFHLYVNIWFFSDILEVIIQAKKSWNTVHGKPPKWKAIVPVSSLVDFNIVLLFVFFRL